MPILRPCSNWPLCDRKAYARHASDTTRLCRQCWTAAPKRYGKVYLDSSETPVPRAKVFKHTLNRQTPVKSTVHSCCGCSCHVCRDGHNKGYHTQSCFLRFNRETQIDAYWEKHPGMTRKQVEKKVRHGLP